MTSAEPVACWLLQCVRAPLAVLIIALCRRLTESVPGMLRTALGRYCMRANCQAVMPQLPCQNSSHALPQVLAWLLHPGRPSDRRQQRQPGRADQQPLAISALCQLHWQLHQVLCGRQPQTRVPDLRGLVGIRAAAAGARLHPCAACMPWPCCPRGAEVCPAPAPSGAASTHTRPRPRLMRPPAACNCLPQAGAQCGADIPADHERRTRRQRVAALWLHL